MSRKDLLPDAGPVLNLRQALYRAARDYRGGIGALALTIGVDPDSLGKTLNLRDQRPIHPELVEDILSATADPRLLASLVRPAGAVAFVPRAVPATREALHALGDVLQAQSVFVRELHEGAEDGVWERHEAEQLSYHADRMISEILAIVAGAKQAAEVARG